MRERKYEKRIRETATRLPANNKNDVSTATLIHMVRNGATYEELMAVCNNSAKVDFAFERA